jgi:hypothetical protein
LIAAIEGLQTRTNIAAEIDSGILYSLALFGPSVYRLIGYSKYGIQIGVSQQILTDL